MHIFYSMDTLKLMLCVVMFSTHLVISKIVVEAKDESGLSNQTAQPLTATTEADYGYYESCAGDEYECEAGVCISMDSFCDGIDDCSDGSDELDCSDYGCSDFSCGNGVCIELGAQCDGIEDCSDGSDEIGCTTNTTCSVDQITCGDNTCVDKVNACDGSSDCTDGSDERDCPVATTAADVTADPDYYGYGAPCPDGKFECDFGETCLDPESVCDGFMACFDETDEMNCTSPQTSSAITTRSSFSATVRGSITASPVQPTTRPSGICGRDSFQCDDGACIANANKCNGQNDCADGSDEVECQTASYSAIMSAITTNKNSIYCDYEGTTYAPNENIEGDKCGGILCNASGQVIVWADPTCSALSAKANSLLLGLLAAFGALYVWR